MAKLLFVGSHGSDDPTRAGLVFVAANGARDAGHEATVGLIADGVLLMKDPIAETAIPVGFPPVKELMKTAVGKGVAIRV
ncbi:MAG: DsrE family protein [Nitrospiraceae bacterium]